MTIRVLVDDPFLVPSLAQVRRLCVNECMMNQTYML